MLLFRQWQEAEGWTRQGNMEDVNCVLPLRAKGRHKPAEKRCAVRENIAAMANASDGCMVAGTSVQCTSVQCTSVRSEKLAPQAIEITNRLERAPDHAHRKTRSHFGPCLGETRDTPAQIVDSHEQQERERVGTFFHPRLEIPAFPVAAAARISVCRDEGRQGLDLWNHLVQHHHSYCGLLARRVRLHRRSRVDDGDKISLQPPPMQDPDSEQQGRTTQAIAIFNNGRPAPVATQGCFSDLHSNGL